MSSSCIALNHADYHGRSWCGRDTAGEWVFTGLDHAALSQAQGKSAEPCRACIKAAVASLRGFEVTPPGWDRPVPRAVMSDRQKRAAAARLGEVLTRAGIVITGAAQAPGPMGAPAAITHAERAVAELWAVVAADDGSGS